MALDHGFRGFSRWSLGSMFLACSKQHMWCVWGGSMLQRLFAIRQHRNTGNKKKERGTGQDVVPNSVYPSYLLPPAKP